MKRVSVVIPTYNEQDTIVDLLEIVRAQSVPGFDFEVIVVDDGSSDSTAEILNQRPELYDRFIRNPSNGGKGAAVLSALLVATGEYILFQDADLEYSPSHYAALLFPIREFGAEIVMGSRFVAPQYTRVQYFSHKVGNRIITLIFNVLFDNTFTDIYSCYLIYKRDIVDPNALVSRGWEQHAEILCRAVRRAKIMYEVPISYHGRSYEEGKKIRARHVVPVIAMILRQRLFG